MKYIMRAVMAFLAFIGLVVVAAGVGLGYLLATHGQPPLPHKMVLALDLGRGVTESPSHNPFAAFDPHHPYVLTDLVQSIDAAAGDDRVKALYAKLGTHSLTIAQVQELRDAIHRFRASGKPSLIFAETIGDFGQGTVDYYLASAFEKIWLQPSGDVGLTGFVVETPFIKEALDKLSITPQFAARHEYKSAIGTFTETGYTPQHRESLQALLSSWTDQVVADVARERGLESAAVAALIDRGPFSAEDALVEDLVDRLGYGPEAESALKALAHDAEAVEIADYHAAMPAPAADAPKIALIHAAGVIQRGFSEANPFGDSGVVGSDDLTRALAEAVEDDAVRAIIIRIDSPGGSYVASDTIWREIGRAREKGKPVIASMASTAASGGYFIAMASDAIVAQPATVTGSIGVFAGKFVLTDFWRKLGISWDEIHSGDNAPMWSMNQGFSAASWQRLNGMLDRIYDDFTHKAAQARGVPIERMDDLARGRIWSGVEAQKRGLVDELGGVSKALELARAKAGIPADQTVQLVTYPAESDVLGYVAGLFSSGAFADADSALMWRIARIIAAYPQGSGLALSGFMP